MPEHSAPDIIDRLTTAKNLDLARAAGDSFKLPTSLRADVDADLANLIATQSGTAPAEGSRAGASATRRAALTELERQLRGGYAFIAGIDETEITEGQRLQVFTSYGWGSGELGEFTDERVLALGRLAPTVSAAEAGDAAWQYPAARLARITAQVAIIEGAAPVASGAGIQQATLVRDTALGLAATTLLRVRFFYCSATRDGDQTPELVKIGYQPRRLPGEGPGGGGGEEEPAPAAPGAATIGGVLMLPDQTVTLQGLAAEGAVTFKVQRTAAGSNEFDDVADEVAGTEYSFGQVSPGTYVARVAGRNPQGLGPWSEGTGFTVDPI